MGSVSATYITDINQLEMGKQYYCEGENFAPELEDGFIGRVSELDWNCDGTLYEVTLRVPGETPHVQSIRQWEVDNSGVKIKLPAIAG